MATKLIRSSFLPFLLVLVAECWSMSLNKDGIYETPSILQSLYDFDLFSEQEMEESEVSPTPLPDNPVQPSPSLYKTDPDYIIAQDTTSELATEPPQTKDFRSDYEYNEEAGGWFKFHPIPATWEDAKFRCHAEGGVLASPLTKELKAAIMKFAKQQSNVDEDMFRIFTGVHSTYSKGVYSSIEGVPLRQLAVTWAPGEPDNYNNSESCLVMYPNKNGVMADEQCGDVLPYVCYKKYADLAITECGTSDPEYVVSSETSSCYKFHGRSLVWSEAYTTCEAEGAHLAIINSETEANVIKKIYKKHDSSICCTKYRKLVSIGFHDTGVHHNFMTIHGETLTEAGFNQWHLRNPDNSTNDRTRDFGEFCGSVVIKDAALLNDVYCNEPIPFICEKNPKSLRPDATWEDFIDNKLIENKPVDDKSQENNSENEPSTDKTKLLSHETDTTKPLSDKPSIIDKPLNDEPTTVTSKPLDVEYDDYELLKRLLSGYEQNEY